MSNSHAHKAAELLRQCANAAKCKNEKILDDLANEIGREGGALADFFEEDGSSEKQQMLPTPQTLKSALAKTLLSCDCCLCVPLADDGTRSKDVVFRDDRLEDYAILVLCGCLFIVRNPTFCRSKNLAEFIITCQKSRKNEELGLFGRLATQPESCSVPHVDGPVKWKKWTHLQYVCNKCRWIAFEDAYHLKKAIVNVAKVPGDFNPQGARDLLDMSNFNIPFINLKRPDIKSGRANVKFYISQIHAHYNTFEEEEDQQQEVFRKVYAYQHKIQSEEVKIREAKEEILIAHQMSQNHRSVAKLLYAFCNKGFDYEIIELVFKNYDGNLENLLLGPYTPRELLPYAQDRSELIDNILWKEMMNLVEAVVDLHRLYPSSNPLDLKPANILVGKDGRGRFTLHLADFGHVVETAPRRATVDYAPPDEDEELELGDETGVTYDVWSMGCILLQILVFIQGRCQKSNLEIFNSNRQARFPDAAFWRREDGSFVLRTAVLDCLALLENQKEEGTKLVVLTLRHMLNVGPQERITMATSLTDFQKAKHNNRPKDQDFMNCGSETWSAHYRNRSSSKEFPAHLAIYRDRQRLQTYYDPLEGPQHESISIDLDVEVEVLLNKGRCGDILISPAAFFPSKSDGEEKFKAIWFKSIHSDYTLTFKNIDEYRDFVALITRQEIIYRDPANARSDFLLSKCNINGKKNSFIDGCLQIWKRLTEIDYNKKFNRSPAPTHGSYRPENENRKTTYILVLWMHRMTSQEETPRKRVCLVIDIGQTTWKLKRDKKDSRLLILPKRKVENMFLSQLRAAIYEENADPGWTTEKYPFIPIDPARLSKELKTGVAEDLDIHFKHLEDANDFVKVLKRHGFIH